MADYPFPLLNQAINERGAMRFRINAL